MIEKDVKIDVCEHIAPSLFKKIIGSPSIAGFPIKAITNFIIHDSYGDTPDYDFAKNEAYLRARTINDINSLTYHSGTRDLISIKVSEIVETHTRLFSILEAINNDNPNIFSFSKQNIKAEISKIIRKGGSINLFDLLGFFEVIKLSNERTIISLSRINKERINIKLDKFTYLDFRKTYFQIELGYFSDDALEGDVPKLYQFLNSLAKEGIFVTTISKYDRGLILHKILKKN